MRRRKIEEVFNASTSKINIKIYLKFWKYIVNKQLFSFINYAFLLILISSMTPLFAFIWNNYINSVTNKYPIFYSILLLSLYVFVKMLIDFGFFFSMRYMDKINFSSWRLLDGDINKKAISIKYEYYEIPELQMRINRAWNFSHGSYIELYQLGLEILRNLTQIIGIFASLVIIDYRISIFAFLSIIPALIGTALVDKNRFEYNNYVTKEKLESDYYKTAKYRQDLIKDIICYNAFGFFNKKYIKKIGEINLKSLEFEKKQLKYSLFEEFVRNAIIIGCVLYASVQVVEGSITLGGLSITFSLIISLVYSIQSVTKNITTIFTRTTNITQFYEFMDMETEVEKEESELSNKLEFNIVLNNVSYQYPFSDNEVLKGINLNIKAGSHIAIVGDNGSGKTTLIKMIMGMIEPTKGNILFKKNSENSVVPDTRMFTAVFQDFCKYKETLLFNVKISDFNKINSDKQVCSCLKEVGFKKNIEHNTILSKEFGGIELSGGEWQKIAAARAIFKDAAILVLDEPTASIDPIEEIKFYKLFDNMSVGKTCFFVTHRLGSVMFSDSVIYLEDGKIVEMGTHNELLNSNGKYAKYWKIQASQYKDDDV